MRIFKSIFGRQIGIGRTKSGVATLVAPGGIMVNDTNSALTATASAGAATLSAMAGKVTSEALTTAAAAAYTLTLTNTLIEATDLIFASVANGTNTQGIALVGRCTAGSGSATILIENQHAAQAFNGTIVISFFVVKGV